MSAQGELRKNLHVRARDTKRKTRAKNLYYASQKQDEKLRTSVNQRGPRFWSRKDGERRCARENFYPASQVKAGQGKKGDLKTEKQRKGKQREKNTEKEKERKRKIRNEKEKKDSKR